MDMGKYVGKVVIVKVIFFKKFTMLEFHYVKNVDEIYVCYCMPPGYNILVKSKSNGGIPCDKYNYENDYEIIAYFEDDSAIKRILNECNVQP